MLYGAMNFPVRPVLDELEVLADLGFDYLELAMDPPQAHYTTIRREKSRILEALERRGMGLVCHLPTFVSTADLTASLRRSSLEEVLGSLEVAAELRARKVVLHPSHTAGLGVYVMDEIRQHGLESLTAIVERSEDLGLCLCLENLFPATQSLVDAEEFVAVFERFPGLKLTLDTGHTNIESKGGRKLLGFIDRFADRLGHVHASDNFGKRDDHLPIGAGTVDYLRVAKVLKGIGYDETVTLEIFSPDRDYLMISREKLAGMLSSV
jgi:sugar phosphate isomerase/epimerase